MSESKNSVATPEQERGSIVDTIKQLQAGYKQIKEISAYRSVTRVEFGEFDRLLFELISFNNGKKDNPVYSLIHWLGNDETISRHIVDGWRGNYRLREQAKSINDKKLTKQYDDEFKKYYRMANELGITLPEINRSRRKVIRNVGLAATGLLLGGGGAYIVSKKVIEHTEKPHQQLPSRVPDSKPTPNALAVPKVEPSPIPRVETAPAREVSAKAIGSFDTKNKNEQIPTLFRPGTDEMIKLQQIPDNFEILGFGTGEKRAFRYRIKDPGSGSIYEVPISQVNIILGEPVSEKEVKPNSFMGIRVNTPESVRIAKKMGMRKVRINGEGCDLFSPYRLADIELHQTLKEAIRHDMEIVLVFHPNRPLPKEELKSRVDCLFSENVLGGYPKVAIELGNEPDNAASNFWENQDPTTFARFIVEATAAIKENRNAKNHTLILAALEWQNNSDKWYSAIINSGIDLNNYAIGLHAYQEPKDLVERLGVLKSFMDKHGVRPPVWITEMGIPDYDKRGIIDMLEFAKKNSNSFNIKAVLLHELEDFEQSFGFMNPYTKTFYPSFYAIQRATQLLL